MKKLFLLIVILLFSYINAQDKVAFNDKLLTKITFSESPMGTHNHDKYVEFSWDFSDYNETVVLYIKPFKDCFNAEKATEEFNSVTILIDDKNYKKKDSIKLFHIDLQAKCLKWAINSENQNSNNWFYYSFVD